MAEVREITSGLLHHEGPVAKDFEYLKRVGRT